jgi:hypothetical protein
VGRKLVGRTFYIETKMEARKKTVPCVIGDCLWAMLTVISGLCRQTWGDSLWIGTLSGLQYWNGDGVYFSIS